MLYSIRAQLVMMFAGLLIIPFVCMAYVFWTQSAHEIRTSTQTATVQAMDQYAESVNLITSQVMDTANQILGSTTTQTWLELRMENNDFSNPEYLMQHLQMKKYISNFQNYNSPILSINIFYQNWDLWNLEGSNYEKTDWFQAYTRNGVRWTSAHFDPRQNTDTLKKESINSFLHPLTELNDLKTVGFIKINVSTSLFLDPLNKLKLGKTGEFYLIDSNGDSVLRQDRLVLPASVADKIRQLNDDSPSVLSIRDVRSHHLYFARRLSPTGWIMVGEVSEAELYQKITALRRNVILVAFVLLGVTIFMAYWFSRRIARPLSSMVRSMSFVERGNFLKANAAIFGVTPKHNEIGYLVRHYTHMIKRLQRYIETEFELNLRQRNAEYKALLLQINPHFLNNTLEVINSLAVQGRSDDIHKVIDSLSRMLRLTLRVDSDLIRLEDEIAYIRAYASIMSTCYGDRVRIEILDDSVHLDTKIPKLLLQPLIENALKYTLEAIEFAHIQVAFRQVKVGLEIRIRDNGVGMSEEQIQQLMTSVEANLVRDVLDSGEKRIGLRNVIARCRIYYGQRFGLSVQSALNQGTEIVLLLPLNGGNQDV